MNLTLLIMRKAAQRPDWHQGSQISALAARLVNSLVFDGDGPIKNYSTIITPDESTTAQVSGTGAVVNLSKASVTLDGGASATINGSELQISVGANSQTVVNGQFLSIATLQPITSHGD